MKKEEGRILTETLGEDCSLVMETSTREERKMNPPFCLFDTLSPTLGPHTKSQHGDGESWNKKTPPLPPLPTPH